MTSILPTFRNPLASVWQHLLHKAISSRRPQALQNLSATQPEMTQFAAAFGAIQKGQPVPLTDSTGSTVSQCAKLAAQFVWAEIQKNAPLSAALQSELKDGGCDPLWSETLADYLAWKASSKPIPYVRYANLSDFVIPLPDPLSGRADLVIALIADWGTGLDDAKWLLSEVMAKTPDVLIHLGDIYYAGMPDEVLDNFLDLINPVAAAIPVYTMSGNHDMYSGGAPFYQLLTQLNATPSLEPYRQQASYFCLRNANWQILAMDTGLHDCDPESVTTNLTYLDPSEAAWHADKLQNPQGRQTVVLSHHQLFTAFGDGIAPSPASPGKALACNPNLRSVFQPFLGNIAIWLWGHEHNFEVFQPYIGLAKGRCIGASAIPVLESQNPYNQIANPDLQGEPALPAALSPTLVNELSINADGVYFHNYAVMTLSAPGASPGSRIDYYQLDSANHGPSQLMFGELIP